MGHRTFAKRRSDRIERLRDQAQFVANRMCRSDRSESHIQRDRKEFSALMWALEEIARLDSIDNIVQDESLTEGERLAAIDAICENRCRPTDEDMQRAPALARQYQEQS
jgi:hypothetical protein